MSSTSLAKRGLNSSEYVELIKIFTLALEKHKDYMNSLNVFPVPDADTGTNMYVSIKGIQDSLKNKSNLNNIDELSKSVADFALLSAQGNMDAETTLVVTTVHDEQIVNDIPAGSLTIHDVPVDIIVTPTKIIRVPNRAPKPSGIFWDLLSPQKRK